MAQQVEAQVGVVGVERLLVERGDDGTDGDHLDAAAGVHAEGLGGAFAEGVDGLVGAEALGAGGAGGFGQLGGGEPGVENGAVAGDGGEAGGDGAGGARSSGHDGKPNRRVPARANRSQVSVESVGGSDEPAGGDFGPSFRTRARITRAYSSS
ncbi:hypothetical protein GCM10010222_30930 [Streptomyces tanashiensis]|nr:hypothetical protein GCM10010222_30930 [Streptomyces tanashiensis]